MLGLYKVYERHENAKANRALYGNFYSDEVLRRGIIIAFPPDCEHTFPGKVDTLIAQMPSVTAGAADDHLNDPYKVGYTRDYVLYFTTTPSSVPGYEAEDYPFTAPDDLTERDQADNIITTRNSHEGGSEDDITSGSIQQIVTARRGYIQVSSKFVEGIIPTVTSPEANEHAPSVLLSNSLDTLYSLALVH